MAKKKKSLTATAEQEETVACDGGGSKSSKPASTSITTTKQSTLPPSPSSGPPPNTLVICRNKHWRYISSYHGQWLNLPPEVLETIALSNYYAPRPQPIDPAVFFDLVRIRRLVDNATSLSVRASNGTTAFALNSSSSSHSYLNNPEAELLGLSHSRGGGGNAKLSIERKFRMREHATSKLSHAYRLDEIATSVATMQSASALEEVAKHVLARNQHHPEAQYVHFFHEKVPSRAMAENTTLTALTDIISQRPEDAAAFRTRAVTRIHKDDHLGAVKDLSEGLTIQRVYHRHRSDQLDLILARDASKLTQLKLDESDYPSSMEPQLLFHRAGAYLSLACQRIDAALRSSGKSGHDDTRLTEHPQQKEDDKARAEARKLVRTYAKRALRDYTAFLSHFDYTPGIAAEHTEAFLEQVAAMSRPRSTASRSQQLLNVEAHSQNGLSEALIKYEKRRQANSNDTFAQIPKPAVHKISDLFNAIPPPGLPSFPPTQDRPATAFSLPNFSEAVTYHPHLIDVLHSLLICHTLIQTSVKEIQRHAYMVARVARVTDGYPIFLPARSPSRADWIEILKRTKNWLGLDQAWDTLCTPPKDRPHKPAKKTQSTELAKRDTKPALDEANLIAIEDEGMRKEYNNVPKPKFQQKDLLVCTERADIIARWVREAPPPGSDANPRRKKRPIQLRALREQASDMSATSTVSAASNGSTTGLEQSVESLDMLD